MVKNQVLRIYSFAHIVSDPLYVFKEHLMLQNFGNLCRQTILKLVPYIEIFSVKNCDIGWFDGEGKTALHSKSNLAHPS